MEEKMTPEQFVYWLNGYLEMENPKTLGLKQTKMIKDHLNIVFNKVTPKRNPGISPNNTNSNSFPLHHNGSTLLC